MEPVKIIDLWQVVLQEPRAAAREAAIILQGELNQNIARENIEKRSARDKKRVVKSEQTGTPGTIKERGKYKVRRKNQQQKRSAQERGGTSGETPKLHSNDNGTIDIIV